MMINLKKLCASLLICNILACGSVKIKDAEWCADRGPLGATCFHTLDKDQERDIPKETWDEIWVGPDHRFGKVCTDPDNFANLKAAILKFCSKTKMCSYEFKKKVTEFTESVENHGIQARQQSETQ